MNEIAFHRRGQILSKFKLQNPKLKLQPKFNIQNCPTIASRSSLTAGHRNRTAIPQRSEITAKYAEGRLVRRVP